MCKVVNRTSYKDDTPSKVIYWLETSRIRKQRIRIFYGSKDNCWNEEFDTIGIVGRSAGTNKIPLLMKNSRSLNGSAISDDCIVRIDIKDSKGIIRTVYKNDSIKFDSFNFTESGNVYNETKNSFYAKCENEEKAKRLAAFMNGTRWSK